MGQFENLKVLAFAVLLLLLVKCRKTEADPVKINVTEDKADSIMTPSEVVKDCDTNFDVFFKKFAADSVFQNKHTKFPLKSILYYSGENPEFVTHYLASKDCRYYDFRKDKDGYKLKDSPYKVVIETEGDSIFYHWRGIGCGINYEFKFALTDGCWYMVEMGDYSD